MFRRNIWDKLQNEEIEKKNRGKDLGGNEWNKEHLRKDGVGIKRMGDEINSDAIRCGAGGKLLIGQFCFKGEDFSGNWC